MKTTPHIFLLLLIFALVVGSGCREQSKPVLLHEGIIWTLQWTDGAGETHGMTRSSEPKSVPGGSGSWNMDLYGRLYSTHIEIINRQQPDLGSQIILSQKLDFVQFGEGGRKFTKQ